MPQDRPHDLYEAEHADRKNARLGMTMFFIYLIVYAGFVGICAFKLSAMETPVLGVNLAIVYGFGLIGFAFVLAVIYMMLCHPADGGGR
jgi:uncharacterized membrane protein (DUF485 family)